MTVANLGYGSFHPGTYTIDVFTEEAIKHGFPENTYEANDLVSIAKLIHNCSREISGIKQIRITINKTHEEPAIS